jgi:hypothetical protein
MSIKENRKELSGPRKIFVIINKKNYVVSINSEELLGFRKMFIRVNNKDYNISMEEITEKNGICDNENDCNDLTKPEPDETEVPEEELLLRGFDRCRIGRDRI